MEGRFTLEELLDFLQAQPDEGARDGWTEFRTTAEWCDVLGVWKGRMRALLHEGIRKHRVERIRVEREAIDGRRAKVTAFSFKLDKVGHRVTPRVTDVAKEDD